MAYQSPYSRDAAVATRPLRLRVLLLASVPDAAFSSILSGPAGDADYTDHCKLDEVRAREIVVDAVNIEREFAFDLLLVALVGLNGVLTSQYIKSTITYCLPMALWVQRMRYPASRLQHVRHNAITAASPWLCAQPSDHLLSTWVIPHGTPTRATYLSTARSGTSPTPCF